MLRDPRTVPFGCPSTEVSVEPRETMDPTSPAVPPGPYSLGSPPYARLPAPQVVLHVLHLLPLGPGHIPQDSQRQRGREPGSAVTNRLVLGRPW